MGVAHSFRALLRRGLGSLGVVALVGAILAVSPAQTAQGRVGLPTIAAGPASAALVGSSFDPGYIISDYAFYSGSAMTRAQIQAFLDLKCPTNNCIDNKSMATTARASSNMCPTPYEASASETFATVLYKVQVSCGISAKVLLVMLQKEQGLVTAQNPSSTKIRIAMGYACPDSSVCDSKFYGFQNQVYSAASQLKRYGLRTSDNVSYRTKYQIGVPYPILYHPNTSCGTKTVTVKNRATTALYYYTPYTPNAAALANLGGLGNSCSSYGNRNFWVYYNSWFGNSLIGRGNDAIAAAYEALGGSAGVLGAAGASPNCATTTVCAQSFANGVIYWSLPTGAYAVMTGQIADKLAASGGVGGSLGYPIGAQAAITGPNGDGTSQAFASGHILQSADGTFIVSGAIRAAHTNLGWVRGALGWPTADQECDSTGLCWQTFQHGAIYQPLGGVANAVVGAIADKFAASGGPTGPLAYPIGAAVAITGPNGDGTSQAFKTGHILQSADGTFIVSGAIRTAHNSLGWVRGWLGWPTADQVCDAARLCSQTFQHGTLYAAPGAAAFAVDNGAVGAKFTASGGVTGVLGYPIGNLVPITGPMGNGNSQAFKTGHILQSASGVFVISGAIRTAHNSLGWVRGWLGWPTADQVCDAGGVCSQTFQHGTLYAAPGAAAFAVDNGAVGAKFTASGGLTGVLGYPIGNLVPITGPMGNGKSQAFKTGHILQSTYGVFIVSGAIRAKHNSLGWVRGALGWPTSDQTCVASGRCTQQFQGGSISFLGSTVTVSYYK